MASPQKRTSAQSRSARQIESKWESVLIEWGAKGRDDLRGTTPFPFVEPKGHKRIDQQTFFDKTLLRETKMGYMYTPVPVLLKKRPTIFTETITPFHASARGTEADRTKVAETDRERQLRQGANAMQIPARGLICTSVLQWVRVEVRLKAPSTEPPPLRLWAFLQPANIGGTRGAVAGQNRDCLDDFPRSGWAELRVLPGGKVCKRKDWDEGKSIEHELAGSLWTVSKIDSVTYVYKFCIEVKNQRTAADLARWKKRAEKYAPENDNEAGCWLKVWVRDEMVDWGMEPADDEANTLPDRMDDLDPRPTTLDIMHLNRIPGAHGFLRERLFTGPEDPKQFHKASTVYVALFNDQAMGLLVDLNKYLKPRNLNNKLEVVSQVVFSAAALLAAVGLRKGLEAWQSKTGDRPAGLAAGTAWPDAMNKEKAETLIKLLETLDLPGNLAVLAADGFAHSSLDEARKSATPSVVNFWSKIYGAVFDFALVDGPEHYRKFCLDRIDKRAAYLGERIQFSKAAKAAAAKKADESKKRQAAWETHAKKDKGLGLVRDANSTLSKLSTKESSVSIEVDGPSWTSRKCLPAPAGAPLPLPGIPLVWSLAFETKAAFKLTFGLEIDSKSAEWVFSARLAGTGKAELAFGLHALWSSLWNATDAATADDFEQKSKASTNKSRRTDHASLKKAAEKLRREALENPPTSFALFQILKKLNEYVAFELEVGASLDLVTSIGFSYRWNPDTGEGNVQVLMAKSGGKEARVDLKDFMLSLGLTAKVRASVSVIKSDYKLAEFPGIAKADAMAASFSCDGQILGHTLPDIEEFVIPWGEGKISDLIDKVDTSGPLIWGKTTRFELAYYEMVKPEVALDLRRTGADVEDTNLIAPFPDTAYTWKQSGDNGSIQIFLHLTSRKQAANGLQMAAGNWTFSESRAQTDVKFVEKGLGLLKQAATSAMGLDEDEDRFAKPMPASDFLEDLMKSPEGAPLFLHGSYLISTKSKSQEQRLLRPTLGECRLTAKPGLLQIAVQVENFLDNVLWVQLREYTKGAASRILTQQGEPWKLVLLEQIKSFGKNGRAGLLQISLNKVQFPARSEDVWEVYPWISLVPHKSGLLNGDLKPRNEMDMERLIRVKLG